MDQLLPIVVKAIADLFDTEKGRALLAELIAYVEGEMAKQAPTGSTSPTAQSTAPTPFRPFAQSGQSHPNPPAGTVYGG